MSIPRLGNEERIKRITVLPFFRDSSNRSKYLIIKYYCSDYKIEIISSFNVINRGANGESYPSWEYFNVTMESFISDPMSAKEYAYCKYPFSKHNYLINDKECVSFDEDLYYSIKKLI